MESIKINFIELSSTDLKSTEKFYGNTFGWRFVHYGDQYMDFLDAGIAGGFAKVDVVSKGGVLVVLQYDDLEAIQKKVLKNGGKISKEIFSFPGGKRFEFIDPTGNELAIWCDK
jgi:hypothetical protein